MKQRVFVACGVAVVLLVSSGCATKKYVAQEVAVVEESVTETNQRIDDVETLVERNQSDLAEQEKALAEVSGTARDALERAIAAGKLAEGKFLYETVLTENRVRFGSDKSDLSDEGKAAIDEFAARVKSENADVYIEVQGHTDSRGSEDYNYKLAEERAEAVRRYLSSHHGIALHRMSTISYGESAPIAGNDTRDERALNRRVALVVLK